MNASRIAFSSLVSLLVLGSFRPVDAYWSSSSNRFMYSLSTTSSSTSIDLTMNSEACADNCQVGDSIVQSGDLIIYEEFDSKICVDLLLTASFATATSSSTGDFCEAFQVESVDGSSECPSPGEYTYSTNMTVTSLTGGEFETCQIYSTLCGPRSHSGPNPLRYDIFGGGTPLLLRWIRRH